MFPERIETERLVLERLGPETVDVFELYELFSGGDAAAVFEHVPQSPYRTPKEPFDALRRAEEQWDEGEVAQYAVRTTDGDLAGTTGLVLEWDRRFARLGLILAKPYWGRGYSGERAAALLELAFDRLDLDVVAVTHGDDNEQSRRAVEKYVERFGGEYDGILRNWVPMDDGVSDEHRYTVTRAQWDEHRPDDAANSHE